MIINGLLYFNRSIDCTHISHLIDFNHMWSKLKNMSKKILNINTLNLSDTGGGRVFWHPLPIGYTVIKIFLIGLVGWALFYSQKIYFYTFWPNLDKFFTEGHEMTFLWKRDLVFRELVIKNHLFALVSKRRYVPHINKLLLRLICETYEDVFMTSLLTWWSVSYVTMN